ncbi:hypothetical protein BDM02DRAFT_3245148 [Thelephora ganbajun]|uniref:Uncharacterized protein n=1 Tax=Thelephora ganbajun TaxID=370292 RepID=A0ACB6ZDZ5_THEGA|nr:hypothetical protein BDM02DRAFT_3245148 [Thelephora ganbajun]
MKFGGDEKTKPFTLVYGKVISREPSLVGRSTVVLHAKSLKWKDIDLVVKISWPSSDRIAENEFLERATKKAESDEDHKWALNHLPQALFAQDVVFDSDSTHEKVASLFDNPEFVNEEYKYERRTLRIIIQEHLYPLKALTNVKDIAQVILDVICIHRWLCDHAGILHRDLSLNNIMYRIIKGKVYGVLMDYDLASWTATLTRDYTKTSQQRTGTPPFMAHGLLDGTDAIHLYRHDVESIFYVMLILVTRYDIQVPEEGKDGGIQVREGDLYFQDWFETRNFKMLGDAKWGFLTKFRAFEVSPSFKDFYDWLLALRSSFVSGFQARGQHDLQVDLMVQRRRQGLGQAGDEVKPAAFDDETTRRPLRPHKKSTPGLN